MYLLKLNLPCFEFYHRIQVAEEQQQVLLWGFTLGHLGGHGEDRLDGHLDCIQHSITHILSAQNITV